MNDYTFSGVNDYTFIFARPNAINSFKFNASGKRLSQEEPIHSTIVYCMFIVCETLGQVTCDRQKVYNASSLLFRNLYLRKEKINICFRGIHSRMLRCALRFPSPLVYMPCITPRIVK